MKIVTFSADSFADALCNQHTTVDVIKAKNHFDYFLKYLGPNGLKAQTIVVEEQYVSKDFLHDYASYYALCFEPFNKFCRRLHFFNTTVTDEMVHKVILNKSEDPVAFWKSYLGFIVVKPIPTTVIGFTVLENYNTPSPVPGRQFWGLRPYKVHVFGREHQLCSLAFQEQDSVLAACATTAIWSMLHKASMDDHTVLKSPSQITKDAASLSADGSRLFPNKGLSVQQICQAILNSGLMPEVKQPDYAELNSNQQLVDIYVSNLYIKKILNAYSAIQIPIILVIKVPDGNEHGLHAITISGFNVPAIKNPPLSVETSWMAENIERIYAHDDQFGPFVSINLENSHHLKTPWTDLHPQTLPTKVTNIIVPVYPKIRISYEDIEAIVIGLDTIFGLFFQSNIKSDLVWDIKIQFSEHFKSNIVNTALSDQEKIDILLKSLPKYIWVATCTVNQYRIFDVTFDATGVNSGMIGIDLICYLPEDIKKLLYEFLDSNQTFFTHERARKARLYYFQFLLDQLKAKVASGAAI